LYLVIAADQLGALAPLLRSTFDVETFEHSINLSSQGSNLRVQIQTDPRYFEFVDRAAIREVLGVPLPVARLEDILQGRVWAASDESRRPCKRRKDLLDIERILEMYPQLRDRVPADILNRL
jgi:hypothetical protein